AGVSEICCVTFRPYRCGNVDYHERQPMNDYQAIDLAGFCNVGISFLGDSRHATIGAQQFRGLPFLVGGAQADPQRCLIGFGAANMPQTPVDVPIDSMARWLVFAHALLESDVQNGGDVGEIVATYTICYAEGGPVPLPIRERFEVGLVPTVWGQYPFLAVPERSDLLLPRHEGQWESFGRRQTETGVANPEYFLWAWQNPHPERMIKSITLEGARRKFAVAGITLSRLDENPFVRTARQEVKITLPRPEDAAKPFDLSVAVDRGVATYPYTLPEKPEAEFLSDSFRGWGEAANTTSSPAYVEIAATPSATVQIKQGDDTLGSASWGALIASG